MMGLSFYVRCGFSAGKCSGLPIGGLFMTRVLRWIGSSLLFACSVATAAPSTQPALSTQPVMVTAEQRDALKQKARQRAALDLKEYSREQLAECEALYQVANKDWRSSEAKASLEKMVEKFPDVNRTGCAMLYLGQYATGEERVRLLMQAVEKHSDCYYLNGAQVGGYGRLVLIDTYLQLGKRDEAKKLADELRKDYPDAITHKGVLISSVIPYVD
jgi:tetratricopeptide (TPR) repeat protein